MTFPIGNKIRLFLKAVAKCYRAVTPCQHFKRSGDKYPTNMQEIFRFSPYKTDRIGYGVHQCKECGKRAFSCIGYHMIAPEAIRQVDAFIDYKIPEDEFIKSLNKHMEWYEKK